MNKTEEGRGARLMGGRIPVNGEIVGALRRAELLTFTGLENMAQIGKGARSLVARRLESGGTGLTPVELERLTQQFQLRVGERAVPDGSLRAVSDGGEPGIQVNGLRVFLLSHERDAIAEAIREGLATPILTEEAEAVVVLVAREQVAWFIAAQRRSLSMTTTALARKLEPVSHETVIEDIESGKYGLSAGSMARLDAALGLSHGTLERFCRKAIASAVYHYVEGKVLDGRAVRDDAFALAEVKRPSEVISTPQEALGAYAARVRNARGMGLGRAAQAMGLSEGHLKVLEDGGVEVISDDLLATWGTALRARSGTLQKCYQQARAGASLDRVQVAPDTRRGGKNARRSSTRGRSTATRAAAAVDPARKKGEALARAGRPAATAEAAAGETMRRLEEMLDLSLSISASMLATPPEEAVRVAVEALLTCLGQARARRELEPTTTVADALDVTYDILVATCPSLRVSDPTMQTLVRLRRCSQYGVAPPQWHALVRALLKVVHQLLEARSEGEAAQLDGNDDER